MVCLANSKTNPSVGFQHVAIPTQSVYVSGKLKNQSICEVSICSYPHSARLCVWQKPMHL
ncbi:unnamed protein product [Ectocarpus sp. CCAP 1310/34]|nr:unnamed protein product [Ectocarpus sp. CCAP 1310/34]